MNTPIRRLAVFVLALFGVLMLNATWLQLFHADALRTHEFNGRQFADRLKEPRGTIFAANETKVAESEPVGGDSDNLQREYPGGPLYAHVVGTFSPTGATGIEEAQNALLTGDDDRLAVRNFVDTLTGNEREGASVELTIDPKVQEAALEGLSALGKNGAAVALDPKTGAVLASVSVPTFDPNEVTSVTDPEDSLKKWNELEQDSDKPLLNRAFNERYPPGSTFKVVTAAAALEDGATPESTKDAPASLDLGAPLPNAWGGPCNGGQPDSLAHSIEQSCNTSMANWAIDLGGQKLSDQATAFGFNSGKVQTPLEAVESLSPAETDRNTLGRAGIGQGNNEATPLQMAMVAAGIANKGEVMKPYLVESVKDSDASVVESAQQEKLSTAVSAKTAQELTDMMVLVTEGQDASAPGAQIPGVQVAGKTGTAEVGDGSTHNWFISFAPANDPKIAVAVVVERGNDSGGRAAAPVAKKMMEAVINE
ncbi:peptidoglycan glycosyltransferase [Nocardiopsis mwathae]|uniref:Peptidoglycan glycosyltransferase n=1 Tax=Nocardiopsis mwathae TaxID=1472723 RepID=A0A7X0D816_9ACTN|nr:penicillin-binding protein 2 [Nocardiopsis mwathae]MBB6174306.1 peptidoglycan glycosyltransferase [Nocardiopsis mwathae]